MKSTRLSIVEHAIADVLLRLAEFPKTPRVRELRARAESYARAARGWAVTPPSEEQRTAMMKLVIDLSVVVMSEGRCSPLGHDSRVEVADPHPGEGEPAAGAPSSQTAARARPAKSGSSLPSRGSKKLKG